MYMAQWKRDLFAIAKGVSGLFISQTCQAAGLFISHTNNIERGEAKLAAIIHDFADLLTIVERCLICDSPKTLMSLDMYLGEGVFTLVNPAAR